jgi:triosephosphate isomerase
MSGGIIIFNLKANFNNQEYLLWLANFCKLVKKSAVSSNYRIIICPSFLQIIPTHQYLKAENLLDNHISIYAQDFFYEVDHKSTSQITLPMMEGLISGSLIGHSETRKLYKNNLLTINKKIALAAKYEIEGILCVGSTKLDLQDQLNQSLKQTLKPLIKSPGYQPLIAWEPIWAIGGNKQIELNYLNEFCTRFTQALNLQFKNPINLLYGASVDSSNIQDILSLDNINGVLIGSASLKIDEIEQIFARLLA